MSSCARVREARALGVDAGDVAVQDELHDVEVVGGEVDRHAGVADAGGQRADARGVGPEDAAEPALANELGSLARRPG